MQIYFAPLEGITGFLFRNIYHEYFGKGMDKYFTPFLVPTGGGFTKHRSMKDILPEYNVGIPIVPQLLSNNAEDFIGLTKILADFGYKEVNLNLGCPYQTVVSKGRGSGFLAKPDELERFLEEIFEGCKDLADISVKTRIGLNSEEEWEGLLSIYNKFPLKELIVHARTRKDFYGGKPNIEAYEYAVENSRNPLCYNGDIFTKADYDRFYVNHKETENEHGYVNQSKTESIMIGRGFLVNPGLLREIRGGEVITKKEMMAFHDRLYSEYFTLMQSDTNTLYKMKELWNYWQYLFTSKEKPMAKYIKQIRKAQKGRDYEAAARELFAACEIKEGASFEG